MVAPRLGDLLIYGKHKTKSRLFNSFRSVDLDPDYGAYHYDVDELSDLQDITNYFGGKDSDKQHRIYDKDDLPNDELTDDDDPSSKLRVESCLGRKDGSSMSALGNLNHDFSSVMVHDMCDVEELAANHKEYEFRQFLDSVRYRGPTAAFKRISEKRRRRYKRQLDKIQSPWWTPDKFWQQHWLDTVKILEPDQPYSTGSSNSVSPTYNNGANK